MVRDLFHVKPDPWQEEALEAFPNSPKLAMRACKGPGKTAVLAWIGWNFMLTRPQPMIGATSINGANLKANLWTELSRWYERSELLRAFFEVTKSEIFSKQKPKTWRLEARTWPQDADAAQIGNALAGLHAQYVMWLADETGDYPDSILPTMEAIFSGAPTEAHIVQAGNPSKLSGPLYRACVTARNLWRVVEITGDPDNPKRSPRIPIEHAREQIKQYGRDNPWVRVNIFGEFPEASLNALISVADVQRAFDRRYREGEHEAFARILGVDVAREGDDKSVIYPRQGLQCYNPDVLRNVDGTQGAGRVARKWADWDVDAVFVDNTGGFGSSWVDNLRRLGRDPIAVHFAEKALNPRYFNKRTEMMFEAVDWIKRGGAMPESAELLSAATQTTYTFKGDRVLVEPKEQIKARLGFSPDEWDAFILTFAFPVQRAYKGPVIGPRQQGHHYDYDPFSRDRVLPGGGNVQPDYQYDPYR